MSKLYKIQLIPQGSFFFGNENTFGDNNQNYFVRSNYFPQQTSLLGMLRYELLKSSPEVFKNNKITDKVGAINLIGAQSFVNEKKRGDFGIIKNIYPVFIEDYKHGINWFVKPNDESQLNNKDVLIPNTLKKNANHFLLENYDPKIGFTPLLARKVQNPKKDEKKDNNFMKFDFEQDENGIRTKKSGPFITCEQVGIRKSIGKYRADKEESADNKKGFYKQVTFKLDDNYCFSFFAELNDTILDTQKERYIQLGGEKSTFKMDIVEIDTTDISNSIENTYYITAKAPEIYKKVILLSDAFLNLNQIEKSCFHISNTVSFRCISTTVKETSDYVNMSKSKGSSLYKSKNINLISKGSVFFFDAKTENETILEIFKNECFQQIGYNHIQIIKPEK
ncbi:type III-B CRISPR module-associated Cmr3 family protein [Marinifilum sp. D737]|uniref:type III-B CRISPR module-associated Cmr3 family protein n=1 Tax=Marinifilum sp. D737 TaxID=2969628 RepID=UPI002274148B|nr:type III-B CRISPR module-associated Cmr3 family protein [Marinifilum sp. D737]MCY1634985.1 hypothetical protein [Marinifilum sp. D737]